MNVGIINLSHKLDLKRSLGSVARGVMDDLNLPDLYLVSLSKEAVVWSGDPLQPPWPLLETARERG